MRISTAPSRLFCLGLFLPALLAAACGGVEDPSPQGDGSSATTTAALIEASSVPNTGNPNEAVGLAVNVDSGVPTPLQVRAGQTFYLAQLDLRAAIGSSLDRGVDGLAVEGEFKDLKWQGVEKRDEDFSVNPNADGTYTRRRFYRDAKWMSDKSDFTLTQVDAQGRATAPSLKVTVSKEDKKQRKDSFFIRRMRAIQFTNDCPGARDCTGATNFVEEALVELRYSTKTANTFKIAPSTVGLKLEWSQLKKKAYTIPVEQIQNPPFAYGAKADLELLTPPGANGAYAPGSTIDVRVTLRDGQGNRLHDEGFMPSYMDANYGSYVFGGIKYYRGFEEPVAVYYRRKHQERMMEGNLIGPAQDIQAIRSFMEFPELLAGDVMPTATIEQDGFISDSVVFPRGPALFGGAFDPVHTSWFDEVSDLMTFTLPANAASGTYFVTFKGRRVYLGEDIPYAQTVSLQVGSPVPTHAKATTGNCQSCHKDESGLKNILHAVDNRATCSGCHKPLGFEYDDTVYVRTHFIHSRSERFEAPLEKCSTCHLNKESIQRTSKSACMSCHTTYPASHVAAFGPVLDPFVGGGRESFDNCTGTCHTNHPGSML